MAMHKMLRLITTKYTNEPTHIFTDCLNYIYVLNTQIKHPTQHNNHADKTILTSMVEMLKNAHNLPQYIKSKHIQTLTVMSKQPNLQKMALKNNTHLLPNHMNLHILHHFYFQKDTWPGPNKLPDKGHVRCLQTYITKHDRETN